MTSKQKQPTARERIEQLKRDGNEMKPSMNRFPLEWDDFDFLLALVEAAAKDWRVLYIERGKSPLKGEDRFWEMIDRRLAEGKV